MTRVSGDWLTAPEVQAVCKMLTDGGHQAYLVGGCVRNALLGAPVADIDISTDARPERVVALAKAAELKPVPTGIEHGTITVIAGGQPHEITTFRKDVETDGRHAVVAFADTIREDALRRDFTMNALYVQADGTLLDPLSGLEDIRARRVRFIEDAACRIREDYLRILRFFRFHAWYGDPDAGMDPDALAAIAENSAGIETLSRERVGAEMLKLLAAPDPAPALAAMRSTGVLSMVLAGSDDKAIAPLIHMEGEAGVTPDALRRLAALGGEDVGQMLRLSRKQTKKLKVLRCAAGDMTTGPELAYRHGAALARDVLLVRAASLGMPPDPNSLEWLEKAAQAQFPVKAQDLSDSYTGPEIGAELRRLESLWIASGFALTQQELLQGN